MAILRLENISKHFAGFQVLNSVSVDILEGERHAVIGPNGAGKTTLFNIISGVHQPTGGSIFLREKNITGDPVHKIARMGISRSFQITNLYPKMTLHENVRNAVISKLNRRFSVAGLLSRNSRVERETNRVIDLVSLSDAKDVPAFELSYGKQRQLELALALALDPDVVLMDEPTAGLNTQESRSAVELIREVTKGKTLVIIEHDMDVVFRLVDRITVLDYGRVLATGTLDEIRSNEEVKNAYLGRQ